MTFSGGSLPVRLVCTAAVFCLFSNASAQDATKPLTLELALQAVSTPHPDLQIAEAERDIALADRSFASARSDFSVNFEGRLQGAKSSLPDATFRADNGVRLLARKNLYDFGRTSNNVDAASSIADARERSLLETRDLRRIDIMTRFFDVLLVDLQYVQDDEFMTVAFLEFDRARDNFNQQLLAQTDLSELEARFQNLRARRSQTQLLQRLNREFLADAMNQPGQLANELVDPPLPGNDLPLPSFEILQPILAQSPRVLNSQKLLEASRQRIEALRADNKPSLDAEFEAGEYPNRKLQGRDELRAGVVLSWPIYQGNRNTAQVAREQAQFYKLQAEAEKTKRNVAQTALRLLLEADQLQRAARNAAKFQVSFTDLALERARALYEVELRTNLGASAAATIAAKLQQRNVEYQLALNLARLEALLGQPLPKADKK